jgi:hypothetical protein
MKSLYKDIKIPVQKAKLIKDSKLFSYIDSDFNNLTGLDATFNEQNFEVLEMDKDATFKEIFTQPEKMAMTQDQILSFVENHKDKLRTNGYATFFLLKNNEDFFVVFVYLYDDGRLEVYVSPFSYGSVWRAGGRHRVVVPQLTLESSDPESLRPSVSLALSQAIDLVKMSGYKIFKEI